MILTTDRTPTTPAPTFTAEELLAMAQSERGAAAHALLRRQFALADEHSRLAAMLTYAASLVQRLEELQANHDYWKMRAHGATPQAAMAVLVGTKPATEAP